MDIEKHKIKNVKKIKKQNQNNILNFKNNLEKIDCSLIKSNDLYYSMELFFKIYNETYHFNKGVIVSISDIASIII